MPVTIRTRALATLGAGALAATVLTALPQQADAARACRIPVTTNLDLKQRFAGGSVSKYFSASALGSVVGGYDHSGNVIMTTYPLGAYPSLVNKRIGELEAVGSMVKSQAPTALAGINADFYTRVDIRYATGMEMVRGPMIKNGAVIRGTAGAKRVVGVDKGMQPYAGDFSVRGSVAPKVAGTPKVRIRSVNWHALLSGGANIYTTAWSNAKDAKGVALYPRPAGAFEWVLNGRNKITSIRSSSSNTAQLGAPVAAGTRVVAFSADVAASVSSVPLGTKIKVGIRQKTDTGVRLLTGVGRGLPVVEGGKPAPLGCRAYSKTPGAKSARPRTFVGWDGKGRWRSFTVPGSKVTDEGGKLSRTGGLSLANAANVAKSLGMKYAYELDGGGTVSFYTRKKTTWTRKDLYGVTAVNNCVCERRMANGLAFLQGP